MMCVLFAASAIVLPAVVSAQGYPSRVVSLVTSQPGGALDFTARTIAPGLAGALGQQVIVDNRAGLVMGGLVAKAVPDGHTLLVQSNALWILALMQKAPYHPTRDFLPVTAMTRQFNILVIHPSIPVRSVKELIALARLWVRQRRWRCWMKGSPIYLLLPTASTCSAPCRSWTTVVQG